jgi:uncharacterized protein
MTRMSRALLLALLLISGLASADVAVPPLTARVTDQTATLTAAQVSSLTQILADFETRKGTQIAVLIVATTQPESIEQYSIRVVEQWRLGRKRVDDGALLIVAKNDHTMRIEVGYGLEGALTDVISARIIREIITPRFRDGDFYGGISDGINRMISVVDGEPLPAPSTGMLNSSRTLSWPFILIAVVVLGQLSRALFGRFPGALVTGGVTGAGTWFLFGLATMAIPVALVGFFATLLGGSSGRIIGPGSPGGFGGGIGGGFGGGFGGFGGGGGSFGGGGGGFSGGGGGFGGGGASGSW